jgi:hypothetical protein
LSLFLLQPHEWNLTGVESGAAPRAALVWLPLMKSGGDPGMIERWLELVGQETDSQRRADLALAWVFAELVIRQDV